MKLKEMKAERTAAASAFAALTPVQQAETISATNLLFVGPGSPAGPRATGDTHSHLPLVNRADEPPRDEDTRREQPSQIQRLPGSGVDELTTTLESSDFPPPPEKTSCPEGEGEHHSGTWLYFPPPSPINTTHSIYSTSC